MRSDNMMMLHANNRYKAKNTVFEGEQISAENTYKAPIEVEVLGKTEQKVTVQGKNLWPLSSYYYAHTGVGFTTIDSGSFALLVNFHGTFTLSANITRYSDDVVTNPRFTIKIFYTDGTSNAFAGFFNNIPADGVEHFVYVTGAPDVTKTIDHIGGWLFDYSSSTFRHIEARNIQLELSSTATTYEPFVPDSPSPDYPSDINSVKSGTSVGAIGRNLFDRVFSNIIHGSYTDENDIITVTTSEELGTCRLVYKLSLQKNTDYTVSLNVQYSLADIGTDSVVLIRETNQGGITFVVKTVPRTTVEKQRVILNFNSGDYNTLYLWLYPRTSNILTTITTAKYSNIQLIRGTYTAETLPAYQLYQSGGVALSEYDLYEGDNWNVENGEYIFDKAVLALDGTENWIYISDGIYSRVFIDHTSHVGGSLAKCSHFKFSSFITSNKPSEGEFDTASIYFRFNVYNLCSSVDEWKALLAAQKAAGTPVTIVYQRATPLTIQGTAHLIKSVPRHTNIYSIPENNGLTPNIKTTMKTY